MSALKRKTLRLNKYVLSHHCTDSFKKCGLIHSTSYLQMRARRKHMLNNYSNYKGFKTQSMRWLQSGIIMLITTFLNVLLRAQLSQNFPSHTVTHMLLRLVHHKRIWFVWISAVSVALPTVNDVSEGCQKIFSKMQLWDTVYNQKMEETS